MTPNDGTTGGTPGTTASSPVDGVWPPPEFDTGAPHSARMYDYWLGGKDNYPADRQLAEMFIQQIPSLPAMARENRDFVERATRYLTAAGVTQFLDIGTGIPTSPNLHEVAQSVVPTAKVAYVDNDPIVLAHARAMLLSRPEGSVAYVDADVRNAADLLGHPEIAPVLDLEQPVGLMLIALLMLLGPDDDPQGAVAALRDALPSGSHLALTHPTGDFDPESMSAVTAFAKGGGMTFVPRSQAEVAEFFGDWELVEPGIVPVRAWRPTGPVDDPRSAYYWAGVARKP
ncbi:MAG: SAM-dependent methyltransferase, partial [Actinobacteria bacterium]|nr:SAM-dependent methyltransferase [Actinomycetota bacterium]